MLLIPEICWQQKTTPMKKIIVVLGLSLFYLGALAQSKDHKLGFTEGYGFQNYKGDLGNSFHFGNTSTYGALTGNLSYYLSRSFDVGLFGSVGDYGYCQDKMTANRSVDQSLRCPGCDRVGLGNLNSRLFAVGIHAKYKFADGYILPENSKIKPYLSGGVALNKITDIMEMNCVNPGNYWSLNVGAGFKYYVTDRVHLGYAATLGYFTSDRLDFMYHGSSSDMYLQSTVTVGIDLF
jgi:hypothetical protein